MNRHGFTMIELIVLLVVVGLVATIAVPRINRESKRMTVENALTSIRGAVTETGMRARSTGKALSLKLMPGDNQFLVEVSEQNLAMTWVPPANSALSKAEDDGVEPFYISAKPSYDLSTSIDWQPEDDNYDDEDNIKYYFYPDGQASGRPIRFDVAGRHFQFDVDRVTGAPLIMEITD